MCAGEVPRGACSQIPQCYLDKRLGCAVTCLVIRHSLWGRCSDPPPRAPLPSQGHGPFAASPYRPRNPARHEHATGHEGTGICAVCGYWAGWGARGQIARTVPMAHENTGTQGHCSRIGGPFFKLRCCFGFAGAVMSALFVASRLIVPTCILLQVGSEAGARAGQVG